MFDSIVQNLEPFAREFTRRGKEIYLVGGAVRNLFLGRPVQDFDFTTNALPTEVQAFFPKVLPTGLQHGTVTVLFRGQSYEVTTFRVDGGYSDGRRPDSVSFTPSLEEDLNRRDFTVNALALNLADGSVVDFHNGRSDLDNKVLRAIGDPGARFDEDALRLLRLFRFASQLGFSIDPDTLSAVGPRRDRLRAVSRERVREELTKALAGRFPQAAWRPLSDLGFFEDLFPGLSPSPLTSEGLLGLAGLPEDLRWPVWLTLSCQPFDLASWEKVLKGLTFSNALVASTLGPCRSLPWIAANPGPDAAKAVIEVWGSLDRIGLGLDYLEALERLGYWRDARGLKAELRRLSRAQEPIFLGDLSIDGKTLIAAGVTPGPRLGQILKTLQREVWADPSLNDRERLTARALELQ